MSTVAPIASSLGLSLEETSAAIGQMGDVGIQGERAGTALRNVFSQLSDESSTVSQDLRDMGVATRNSSGEVVSLTQLLSNMESAGVEAGDAAAKLFGTEAGPAMAALMQEGSDALAQNTAAIEEAGATQSMAETQRDTLNAEMQIARSNIEDVGIAIGGDLLPNGVDADRLHLDGRRAVPGPRRGSAKDDYRGRGRRSGARSCVARRRDSSTVDSRPLGSLRRALGAASTVAGVNMGALVPSLLATNVALGPITAPVWLIIAAFGALAATGAAVAYAWKNNIGGIRDTTMNALGTVKGWLDAVPGWVLLLAGPIGQLLYLAWRENLFGIQDIVGSVFDWIGSKIDWLTDKIDAIPGSARTSRPKPTSTATFPSRPKSPRASRSPPRGDALAQPSRYARGHGVEHAYARRGGLGSGVIIQHTHARGDGLGSVDRCNPDRRTEQLEATR